jgi:uncharacterized protein YprB with RNaseH-like and TPR domain
MLRSTFLHIHGVHPQQEKDLWRQGILTWDDLRAASLPANDNQEWYHSSRKAYRAGDANYFAERLANNEHWRLAVSFPAEAMFLDIETTGFSHHMNCVTIVGWSIGGPFNVLVNGRDDPEDFISDVKKAKSLVTFNGRSFDMRFLNKLFGAGVFPKGHADLRYLCQNLGLSGGMKAIEEALGLSRQTSARDGGDAVILWNKYVQGRDPDRRRQALRELIVYNHADVENLKLIFDCCLARLKDRGTPVKTRLFADLPSNLDFSGPRFPFSLELMDD